MFENLRLGAPAMALAISRLEDPGVLVGRARSMLYRERITRFFAWIIDFHALARFEHDFPLARPGMAQILGTSPSSIQRLIATAKAIGLLVERTARTEDGRKLRRRDTETVSPTPGSKSWWWMPDRWDLGPDFLALLPQRISFDFAAPIDPEDGTVFATPLPENQFDQEVISKGRDRISRGTASFLRKTNRTPYPDRIEMPSGLDDPEDEIDEALEGALEGYRRAAVPRAMPDDRRLPPAPPLLDDEFETALRALGSLKDVSFSDRLIQNIKAREKP